MSFEIVCKLKLENDPRDYGSNDIEQILQSSVTVRVINTSQIKANLIDCYQTNQ